MSRLGIEQQYLASLREILDYGEEKHPERKLEAGRKLSHYTRGISHVAFTHYMADGFPLFTHRKLWLKNTAVELEGFIKGITDKKWYQDRSCPYWDQWSNPKSNNSNDLGPIYGYQWRSFNKTYSSQNEDDGDFNNYTDQLKNIVDTLKSSPNDRRMVCSAYNPNQFEHMSLVPCHIIWGVDHWNGKLNLWWTQRSVDAYLGIGANISSYALLLLLLCKESGFKPGKLTFWGVDYHLYSNQFENAKLCLGRMTHALPTVEITGDKSIFDWTYKDFVLKDYVSEPPLEKVEVVV